MFATAILALAIGAGAPTLNSCPEGGCQAPETKTFELQPYDYDVDADIFFVYRMADELCPAAREILEAGSTFDEMVDAAVAVLYEEGVITTPEGAYYLQGLLLGCVTV